MDREKVSFEKAVCQHRKGHYRWTGASSSGEHALAELSGLLAGIAGVKGAPHVTHSLCISSLQVSYHSANASSIASDITLASCEEKHVSNGSEKCVEISYTWAVDDLRRKAPVCSKIAFKEHVQIFTNRLGISIPPTNHFHQ